MLKPVALSRGPRWRIQWYVGIYQRRDETGSLCRPDLYSSTRCIIPYIYGFESSSLYTCNTSWHSVHYMILNKPLVRLYYCASPIRSYYDIICTGLDCAMIQYNSLLEHSVSTRNNISQYSVSTACWLHHLVFPVHCSIHIWYTSYSMPIYKLYPILIHPFLLSPALNCLNMNHFCRDQPEIFCPQCLQLIEWLICKIKQSFIHV